MQLQQFLLPELAEPILSAAAAADGAQGMGRGRIPPHGAGCGDGAGAEAGGGAAHAGVRSGRKRFDAPSVKAKAVAKAALPLGQNPNLPHKATALTAQTPNRPRRLVARGTPPQAALPAFRLGRPAPPGRGGRRVRGVRGGAAAGAGQAGAV